jgi:hypothetical protein
MAEIRQIKKPDGNVINLESIEKELIMEKQREKDKKGNPTSDKKIDPTVKKMDNKVLVQNLFGQGMNLTKHFLLEIK